MAMSEVRVRDRRHRGAHVRTVLLVSLVAVAVIAVGCTAAPESVEFPTGTGGVVSPQPAEVRGPIRLDGAALVDSDGRTVQIHGINMVRKAAPFRVSPDEPGFAASIDELQRAGFNGVRLGVWMASLMPEPGVVDQEYLAEVERGVDALSAANMWVLLDFHQDVFTGFPAWATTPSTAALPATVDGAEQAWFLSYFSPLSTQQWEDLFHRVEIADSRSAVELMGDGVAAVAARFADAPNVIGIDLMNEPWPGAAFLACLLGGCAERYAQLMSIYGEYTERVRDEAPTMPVWLAPFNWGAPFQGNADPGSNVGISFHSYCLHTDGGEPEQPTPVEHSLCGAVYDTVVNDALHVAAGWDAPAMLTEFGASASPLNTTRLTQIADEQAMSWFYWDDNYYRAADDIVRSDLTRVYPQATAGTVEHQRFDPSSGRFEMTFRPDPYVSAPTVITVPGRMFPDGYEVTVAGGHVVSAANAGQLSVVADAGEERVVVTLVRA